MLPRGLTPRTRCCPTHTALIPTHFVPLARGWSLAHGWLLAAQVVLERYPKSVKLLRSYGNFLETVKNDPWMAQRYYQVRACAALP